ncbi:ATP F0F1 synthase subunit B [Phenylobacterium sp.]|jgi:F-type H+-transporting ATPase subunit b|uniref:F0F1 ATP synthase subunit B family protein n=1 Tax=Phenylobacterium sp. TaxID=1871053 RepID=UPI0025D04037|nr:ATP F0F1 synthase subunit B [Phenylobacterium sp.]MCA3720739.1 ATP F0F1 synthase subunit B [Phenylobacterium sp.]
MNPFHISLDPGKPEFWIAAGLLIFLAIVVFVARAPQMLAGRLDAQRDAIQNDLDEAARIRAEAERLLAELKAERTEAERQVRDMLAAAEEQARTYEADAKARLEESLARRQQMAERKIANAEAQAEAEVRAAAVDLATRMAEQVLADRLAGASSDPLVDRAIPMLAEKFR